MSMIAKVAQALAETDGHMFSYEDQARAVLQALREPTERMISEMESAASFGIGRPVDEEAIPRVWTWAIDAALKEQPE